MGKAEFTSFLPQSLVSPLFSIQGILLFQSNFFVSSYTCFYQVFFGRPCFLLPLSSRPKAALKARSSFPLCTFPYHLTLFAVANQSTAFFNPGMSICSSDVFLSTTFRQYMTHMIALSVFLKNCFFIFHTMSRAFIYYC